MKNTASAYHMEIREGKNAPYGLIRTSYREGGKVKKRTLCCISGVPLGQLQAIKAAVQSRSAPAGGFRITGSREYGASFACVALMKQLGLHTDISSRHGEDWVRSCLAMIAGRIVYAGSKLSLSHAGQYSALWETCGIDGDVDVNAHCYDPMDRLLERQDAIQRKLAAKHLSSGTLILYDITSCYMEGDYADSGLVAFGYNRDGKRGHEQIVISLLCSRDGCPVAVEVLKGNTKDETTVLDKVKEVKEKYGIDKVVFVGDRGMVTQARYEELDHGRVKVISALRHDAIQKLCERKVIQLGLFDEKNIVEVIDGDMRYCLCKNPFQAEKERATRQALLEKTAEALDEIMACRVRTKYSKEVRAGKVLDKYKMGKFVVFEGEGESLSYRLDVGKIEREASLDGCYVVFTDVSQEDMTAAEAVESYKGLAKVEQAFRSMKTVRLEVRPVYHRTDDRIRSHVFICMLAYYVMWHMKQRLRPLFGADGKGAKRKYAFGYVIEALKGIRKDTVEVCGVETAVVTAPNEEQRRILELLGVDL